MGNSLYLTENHKVFLSIERRIDKNLFDINNTWLLNGCMYGVSDASAFEEENMGGGSQRKEAPVALLASCQASLFRATRAFLYSLFKVKNLYYIFIRSLSK